jgi:hypothetical protein
VQRVDELDDLEDDGDIHDGPAYRNEAAGPPKGPGGGH